MWRISSPGRAISLPFGVLHTTHDLGVCWTGSLRLNAADMKYHEMATIQMSRMMPDNNILYDRGSVTRIKRVFLNVNDVRLGCVWAHFGLSKERINKMTSYSSMVGWLLPTITRDGESRVTTWLHLQ